MTDNHRPITPPPELVREWQIKIENCSKRADREAFVAKVFQLGADHELEACCAYIKQWFATPEYRAAELRAARRPKPPSLKEQALEALDSLCVNHTHENIIRRALESLPD